MGGFLQEEELPYVWYYTDGSRTVRSPGAKPSYRMIKLPQHVQTAIRNFTRNEDPYRRFTYERAQWSIDSLPDASEVGCDLVMRRTDGLLEYYLRRHPNDVEMFDDEKVRGLNYSS